MRYTLTNLLDHTSATYINEQALAAAWVKLNRTSYSRFDPNDSKAFALLNLTGKDTVWRYFRSPSYQPGSFVSLCCASEMQLRPFMVTDEQGRSVDIRKWPASVWSFLNEENDLHDQSAGVSVPYRHNGAKPRYNRHDLRTQGIKARKIHNEMQGILDDDELSVNDMQLPRIRCKKFNDEYRVRSLPEKSWKSQCKARKQWGKHCDPCGAYVDASESIRTYVAGAQDDSTMDVMAGIDFGWFDHQEPFDPAAWYRDEDIIKDFAGIDYEDYMVL